MTLESVQVREEFLGYIEKVIKIRLKGFLNVRRGKRAITSEEHYKDCASALNNIAGMRQF